LTKNNDRIFDHLPDSRESYLFVTT